VAGQFLNFMSIALLGRWSKNVSYVLFFLLPIALVVYGNSYDPKLTVPRGPMVAMFAAALLWQLFTVCYHPQFLSWVLAALYAIALGALVLV
jgi:hypothetical protein